MVGKNRLHSFISHFGSIFSKIMRFSNCVIFGSANIHGSVSAFKWSISSTLLLKCSPFPQRFSNSEILALESGISNFDFLQFSANFQVQGRVWVVQMIDWIEVCALFSDSMPISRFVCRQYAKKVFFSNFYRFSVFSSLLSFSLCLSVSVFVSVSLFLSSFAGPV